MQDKNFFGGGRIFSAEVEGKVNDFENNEVKLTFALNQPYLFNNNISLTVSPTIGLFNYLGISEYIYSKNLIRLSYFIAPYTFYQNAYVDLTLDYLRERYKKDYYDEDSTFFPKGYIASSMNSVMGLTLVHNSTNDLFNPSKGGYQSFTFESAWAYYPE
jgi:outer membrane protein assembly factor BamA